MQRPTASNIIVPQGMPVKRIVIEIDAKGSCLLRANTLSTDGLGRTVKGPMDALEVAMILNAMAGNSIGQYVQIRAEQEKNSGKKIEIEEGAASDSDDTEGSRHN